MMGRLAPITPGEPKAAGESEAEHRDRHRRGAPSPGCDQRGQRGLSEDRACHADELADADEEGEALRRKEICRQDKRADPTECGADPDEETAERSAGKTVANRKRTLPSAAVSAAALIKRRGPKRSISTPTGICISA
jgi:hypothetical protein